jgi:hypothetical protein
MLIMEGSMGSLFFALIPVESRAER